MPLGDAAAQGMGIDVGWGVLAPGRQCLGVFGGLLGRGGRVFAGPPGCGIGRSGWRAGRAAGD